jgi:hypothetical protein
MNLKEEHIYISEPNLPQLVENLHIPIHCLYEDDDEKETVQEAF